MIPNLTRSIGRRGLIAGSAGAAAIWATPLPALAQAQQGGQSAVIDVDRARAAPIPIAIPDFGGADGAASQLGRDLVSVITNDLQGSGLFRVLNPAAYIQAGPTQTATPNFNNWRPTGAQALVAGRVEGAGGGNVRVEFRLWDILPGTQIEGTAYTAAQSTWRRIGHMIADRVYERLLGEKGYFDTRIVYISGTGPRDRRTKRLAIMDQDGENNRFLTDGTWLTLTPRFHPTRDIIAFMSYANNRPRVYLFDLSSGRQTVLGDFRGMTFAPRFAPDGNSVIMAVTDGGGSDIISMDLGSRAVRRLTNSGAIDVSPCYSPDGSQITFASDRGGDQQIYVMGAGGGDAKRISFGQGRYATPVWSPRGDLIAFTRYAGENSNFAIGVMHPDGSGERILSESWSVEGPTFAPNGRVMMFWRETRARDARGNGFSSRLVSIDITGFNERVVTTPTDASDPAWSPLET
jgi:TolB protein